MTEKSFASIYLPNGEKFLCQTGDPIFDLLQTDDLLYPRLSFLLALTSWSNYDNEIRVKCRGWGSVGREVASGHQRSGVAIQGAGTNHCMADIPYNWFGFGRTSKYVVD